MFRVFVILSFLFLAPKMHAQRIADYLDFHYSGSINSGRTVSVSSTFHKTVSIRLNVYEFKNLKYVGSKQTVFIIPPHADSLKLVTYKRINPEKKPSFRFNYRTTYGDITKDKHDNDFIYQLPYPIGKKYKVIQAYNGSFSHTGKNALDFNIPKGEKVCAARGGLVVRVKEDSNTGCSEERCKDQGNFIYILHDDSSLGHYVHFKQNGVKVNVGDKVKKGDVIGYSGETGFANRPHLHFQVNLPSFEKNWVTTVTKFATTKSDDAVILEEKGIYLSTNRAQKIIEEVKEKPTETVKLKTSEVPSKSEVTRVIVRKSGVVKPRKKSPPTKTASIEPPQYPGGMTALQKEVEEGCDLPPSLKNQKGKILIKVSFFVLEDGSVQDVKILESTHSGMEENVIQALSNLTHKFIPGLFQGDKMGMLLDYEFKF